MEPIYYPGTVDGCRALIDRLTPQGEWISLHGENVLCCEVEWQPLSRRTPNYACWKLTLDLQSRRGGTPCAAMVATYSPRESRTKLVFLDGYDPMDTSPEPKPMGGALAGFYLAVSREIARATSYLPTRIEGRATTLGEGGAGKKGGRSRLTQEEWQERKEKVKEVQKKARDEGLSEKVASELLGLPYSTFRYWRKVTKNC